MRKTIQEFKEEMALIGYEVRLTHILKGGAKNYRLEGDKGWLYLTESAALECDVKELIDRGFIKFSKSHQDACRYVNGYDTEISK